MKEGILDWDGSPRAVVPSESMRESSVPILATREHAENSPNEYGLAIFVMEEPGDKVAEAGTEGGDKEATEDVTEGGAKDVTAGGDESGSKGAKEVAKDVTEDAAKEDGKDGFKDVAECGTKGVDKDSSKHGAEGGTKGVDKDLSKGVTGDAAIDIAMKDTEAVTKGGAKDSVEGTTGARNESKESDKVHRNGDGDQAGDKTGGKESLGNGDGSKDATATANGRTNTSTSRVSVMRQLPMYYVSPRVAKSRGRGLLHGWYVVPEVGKKFCIHATNVSRAPPSGRKSAIEIRVDGTHIFSGLSLIACGINDVFKGFAQASKYSEGSVDGTETIREFKFASVNPVAEPDANGNGKTNSAARRGNPLKTTGCVELQVAYGKLERPVDANLPTLEEGSMDVDSDVEVVTNVDEKAAIKAGCSVKTERARANKDVAVRRIPGKFVVDTQAETTCITIYFREKYWLQARSIIDGEGKLWIPSTDDTPVDLTANDDANGKGEPAKKKAKTEIVDLTVVKDNIDLTAE